MPEDGPAKTSVPEDRPNTTLPGDGPATPDARAGFHPLLAWRGARERMRGRMPAPLWKTLELLVTIAIALALAEGVQASAVKPFKIPSGSMEPTLKIGQRVLVNRLVYDFRSPSRGDVVVFHPPAALVCGAPLPPGEPCPHAIARRSSEYFVKRVIGLPGDRLSVREGHPVINGHELTHEPYITPCGDGDGCNLPHTIVIPPGHYFMMGDNRGDSDDSRFWGPVPSGWIIGEVFFTYWPPDRFG